METEEQKPPSAVIATELLSTCVSFRMVSAVLEAREDAVLVLGGQEICD